MTYTLTPADRLVDLAADIVNLIDNLYRRRADQTDGVTLIEHLATMAAPFDIEGATICDGCDRKLSRTVMDSTGWTVPGATTAYDGNGDPDVTICGLCVAEYEERRCDDHDEVSDAEWAELLRQAQEDEADYLAAYAEFN